MATFYFSFGLGQVGRLCAIAAMKYLVLAATGRQGSAVVDALLARKQVVVATTRNPESPGARALVDKGVTRVLRADFGDVDSLEAAIKESGASRVWFMTQMASGGLLQSSRAKEAAQGRNVIDAIKRCGSQVEYVVFSSVGDADKVPEAVSHFHSKADVERCGKQGVIDVLSPLLVHSLYNPASLPQVHGARAVPNLPLGRPPPRVLPREP